MRIIMNVDAGVLQANIEKLLGRAPKTNTKALTASIKKIYKRSQQLVPVDTGSLKSAGSFSVTATQDTATGIVSYTDTVIANPKSGKSTVEYATPVHEIEDAYHPIGQAKFLTVAINEWVSSIGPDELARDALTELGL